MTVIQTAIVIPTGKKLRLNLRGDWKTLYTLEMCLFFSRPAVAASQLKVSTYIIITIVFYQVFFNEIFGESTGEPQILQTCP